MLASMTEIHDTAMPQGDLSEVSLASGETDESFCAVSSR